MNYHCFRWTTLSVAMAAACALAASAQTEEGFKSLFNGRDLTGWEGVPELWSVRDGAITGQTTRETPAKNNTFLVWKGGDVGDFELRATYRLMANNDQGFANSGIQYRSKIIDPSYFVVGGYQADMEAGKSYSGILYEERGRGILAQRGQKVVIKGEPDNPNKTKIEVTGSLGDSAEIQSHIKSGDWNEYVIIAQGNHLRHFINGLPTIDVTDEQTAKAAKSGVLALQLHAGQPMTAQFKNIRIKNLSARAAVNSELDQVQGVWVPTEGMDNGEPLPKDALAAARLKIKGNEFVLDYTERYQGKLALNGARQPKQIDATLEDGSEVSAIYEVSSDLIKICYAQPGNPRPTTFASRPGSEQTLLVCKRGSAP